MNMMGNGVQDKVHVVCMCWLPLVVSQETDRDTDSHILPHCCSIVCA